MGLTTTCLATSIRLRLFRRWCCHNQRATRRLLSSLKNPSEMVNNNLVNLSQRVHQLQSTTLSWTRITWDRMVVISTMCTLKGALSILSVIRRVIQRCSFWARRKSWKMLWTLKLQISTTRPKRANYHQCLPSNRVNLLVGVAHVVVHKRQARTS